MNKKNLAILLVAFLALAIGASAANAAVQKPQITEIFHVWGAKTTTISWEGPNEGKVVIDITNPDGTQKSLTALTQKRSVRMGDFQINGNALVYTKFLDKNGKIIQGTKQKWVMECYYTSHKPYFKGILYSEIKGKTGGVVSLPVDTDPNLGKVKINVNAMKDSKGKEFLRFYLQNTARPGDYDYATSLVVSKAMHVQDTQFVRKHIFNVPADSKCHVYDIYCNWEELPNYNYGMGSSFCYRAEALNKEGKQVENLGVIDNAPWNKERYIECVGAYDPAFFLQPRI